MNLILNYANFLVKQNKNQIYICIKARKLAGFIAN